MPTRPQMEIFAKRWGPFGSIASLYMLRVADNVNAVFLLLGCSATGQCSFKPCRLCRRNVRTCSALSFQRLSWHGGLTDAHYKKDLVAGHMCRNEQPRAHIAQKHRAAAW